MESWVGRILQESYTEKIKKIANSQNVILFNQIDESVLTKEQLQNLYQYRALQMLLNSAYGATKSNK